MKSKCGGSMNRTIVPVALIVSTVGLCCYLGSATPKAPRAIRGPGFTAVQLKTYLGGATQAKSRGAWLPGLDRQ